MQLGIMRLTTFESEATVLIECDFFLVFKIRGQTIWDHAVYAAQSLRLARRLLFFLSSATLRWTSATFPTAWSGASELGPARRGCGAP